VMRYVGDYTKDRCAGSWGEEVAIRRCSREVRNAF